MNNKNRFLLVILFVVLIYSLVNSVYAQTNNTSNTSLTPEDMLNEAQNDVDRSINILNMSATMVSVLAGLIAIIIAVVGVFGFFQYRTWKGTLQGILDKTKKHEEKIKEKAEEIEPIIIGIKQIEEEVRIARNSIINENMAGISSEELKEKVNTIEKKIEILETFGRPLKAEDYLVRVIDNINNNKYETALEFLGKALELKPDFVQALFYKAFIYGEKGNYEKSLSIYNKTLELKPDYAEAWNNKSVILKKMRNYEKALEANDKALEFKHNFAEAWDSRGTILCKIGKIDDSIDALNKALELKHDYDNAWFNMACAYSLKGDKELSLKNLAKAIELNQEYKEKAKNDEDFKNLWNNPEFKKLVE